MTTTGDYWVTDDSEFYATVSRASVVRIVNRPYSVSSRLMGRQVRVRVHADIVELDYQGARVAVMQRLTGKQARRIDYRHVIHSLVRKPGAFRAYAFRDDLFPRLEYRRAYDALLAHEESQADFEYVRILQLAASDGEELVRGTLAELLERGAVPHYEAVRATIRGARTEGGVPDPDVGVPDLSRYDRLLSRIVEEAAVAA